MAAASLKLSVALACVLLLSSAACHGLGGGRCPANPSTANDPTVNQDVVTPNALDNQYYKNVLAHKVLFTSDAALLTTPATTQMVRDSANTPGQWEAKFNKAMVKMGAIDVKTGKQGEIRRKCRVVNH
uniref:Peroxidase 2 n=1 Tax=Aegilops tauschii TaxID=37682 RepID=M8BTE6_AEGTA